MVRAELPLAHLQQRLHFLREDRHPEIASLHALNDAELEHLHDVLHGGTSLECAFDVPVGAGPVL